MDIIDKYLKFREEYENYIAPLSRETHLAYFIATISGKSEDYQKAAELELKLSEYYADKEKFEFLKEVKTSGKLNEPVLQRELELIYNSFAANQFDENLRKKIIEISTELERKFATYRAEVNGKQITDNELDEILETSTDGKQLEATWKASKKIGALIANEVIELAKLRNEAARQLGYENYHAMSLELGEQSAEELDKLFDELDELTSPAFEKLKEEIDAHLAGKYGIRASELRPWHYQDKFFQQGPKFMDLDLDEYYKDKDVVEIVRNYYNGIGLEIDDILAKSDLYEKPGKYQHAYCTDIDRNGDVRVVCNVKPNYKWTGTLLHEFGHAVYDKYIKRELPWELRTHAHIFTTEAIAMLFGRMAANPAWLRDAVGVASNEAEHVAPKCDKTLAAEQLIFSRWVQVVYRFEKAMYENPERDLNALWFELVEKYQKLKIPEGRSAPDWAAKIHIALYPAYYHNYILGEILASQLYYYISEKVLDGKFPHNYSFVNQKDTGEYLRHLFFEYGALYRWDKLIVKATGEELTPKYYARQFVKKIESTE